MTHNVLGYESVSMIYIPAKSEVRILIFQSQYGIQYLQIIFLTISLNFNGDNLAMSPLKDLCFSQLKTIYISQTKFSKICLP